MNNAAKTPEISAESQALLFQLMEQMTQEIQSRGHVDVEAYARQYPQLAEAVRGMAVSLQALGDLAQSAAESPSRKVSDDVGGHQLVAGVLGDYRILREVGRGGMGVVYEAQQISLGRRVALKVLPFAAILDSRQLARFKNEAHAAACLQHQNIVPVYSVGCERGVHYYAMQYIEGQSLAQVIRDLRHLEHRDGGEQETKIPDHGDAQAADNSVAEQLVSGQFASGRRSGSDDLTTAFVPPSDSQVTGPLPEIAPSQIPTQPIAALSTSRSTKDPRYFHSIARLGIQAAEALDHAHKHGVIHRDIKPANLLLDGTGNLWITDFGLARIESDPGMTMTGDLVGTIRYMSPEQALAKRVIVDHRTDVYSLGVTLYELLTLEPAYTGRDRHELLKQIALDEPRRPRAWNRAIPDDLETIVRKAMEKRPEDRYATAQDLADDLRRLLDDKPIAARRPTIFQHVARWSRRHKPLVASALSIGAILLVAITLVSLSQREIAQRRLRVQQGINEALTEVARLRGAAEKPDGSGDSALAQAREQLQRAVALAEGGPTAPELLAQVRNLRDELDEEKRDRQLLAALDRAWLVQANVDAAQSRFAKEECIPLLREAIAAYGIAVGGSQPDDVAVQIRARPDLVRQTLIAALEEWRELIKGTIGITWRNVAGNTTIVRVLADSPAGRDGRLKAGDQLIGVGTGRDGQIADIRGLTRLEIESLMRGKAGTWVRLQVITNGESEPRMYDIQRDPTAVWLRDVVEAADKDPWRQRLREAYDSDNAAKQREDLEQLAAKADLKRQPVRLLVSLGQLLAELGSGERAIVLLQKVRQEHPGDLWANQSLAEALRGTKPPQLTEAVRFYTAAIALRPDSAGLHLNLGNALGDQGRLEDAAEEYRAAIRIAPQYAMAHSNFGLLLDIQGRVEEAIAEHREAMRLAPDVALHHLNFSRALLSEQGSLAAAIAEARRAIELDPDDARAHCNLGSGLETQGNLSEAVAAFREAIRLAPDLAAAHINLGNAMLRQRVFAEADEAYREAIRLEPGNALVRLNLGNSMRDQGKLEEAIAEFNEAIRLKPDFVEARINLGNVLHRQGRAEEAIAEFREAIRLDPEHPLAYLNLGACLDGQRKFEEALVAVCQAIRLDPNEARSHCGAGTILCRMGQYEQGIAELREAIRLEPDDFPSLNNLASQLCSTPDLKLRNPAEALVHAKNCVELQPQNAACLCTLGAARYRNGQFSEAIAALKKSLEMGLGGNEAEAWLWLSMSYWQLGEKEEARRWYDRASEWLDKNDVPEKSDMLPTLAEAKQVLGITAEAPQPAEEPTPPEPPSPPAAEGGAKKEPS